MISLSNYFEYNGNHNPNDDKITMYGLVKNCNFQNTISSGISVDTIISFVQNKNLMIPID